MQWPCWRLAPLAVCVVLMGIGCGGARQTVPVEGVVTLDGEPVEAATVVFMPDGGGPHSAQALTDADGVFRLSTFQPGDGAVPGEYRVLVSKTTQMVIEGGISSPPKPEELMRMMMQGQRAALKKSAKSRAPQLIPARYGEEDKTPLRCQVPHNGRVQLELKSK